MAATERTGLTAGLRDVEKQVETRSDQYLVNHVQLKGWPASTLQCARLVKALIIAAVLATSVALVVSYFGGALVLQTAVVKVAQFQVPQLVLCPVWGQSGLHVSQARAWVGNVATTPYSGWREIDLQSAECESGSFSYLHIEESEVEVRPVEAAGDAAAAPATAPFTCACLDAPEASLREEDIGKQALRVQFAASFADGHSIPDVAFGFAPGPNLLPGEWAYAALGHRTLGAVELELRTFGKTPITSGSTLRSFTFFPKSSYPTGAETELVITPKSFFITKVKDVSSVFSVFALVSFLVLLMANMNSVALFNLCFPVQLKKSDPQQLAPHWCLRSMCGGFACCQPLDKDPVV